MDTPDHQSLLRHLPSVDVVLRESDLAGPIEALGRGTVADIVRRALDRVRARVSQGDWRIASPEDLRPAVLAEAKAACQDMGRPFYRRVINATGVILHTGLGRALLPKQALEQVAREMTGYSLLQVDIDSGKRSRRDRVIEDLLQRLTGCQAATVVNNNAAGTAIVLNTIAKGKEVIVSRGQLVEIGGSFRLPDVIASSGARLVEVGTTNKTHPEDYTAAITANTAAILRVHPSNYRIQGFTAEVPAEQLVEIAHTHNLLMVDDLGAGALIDMARFGFEPEPTLPQAVAHGADVVLSSGDKLIGGPQAGIILGTQTLIEAVRKNPFARIVRVDKVTLALLEATLKCFLDPDRAMREIPTLRMVTRSPAELAEAAQAMIEQVLAAQPTARIAQVAGQSQTGSGSLPTQHLATTCVAVTPVSCGAEALAQALRRHEPPIFTRIEKDRILIDPRTLQPGEDQVVVEALVRIIG